MGGYFMMGDCLYCIVKFLYFLWDWCGRMRCIVLLLFLLEG
jgi:hypothetical protein